MSEGEGGEEIEREQEKLGLRGGKKIGPLKRGDRGYWRGCGGAAGTVRRGSGYWRSCRSRSALVRSVCTVGSNFGGDLDVSETGL